MAKPVTFEQSNMIWKGTGNVVDLPAFYDTEQDLTVSCWELTETEILQVARTGKVWLYVWGKGHPPVMITGELPFQRTKP